MGVIVLAKILGFAKQIIMAAAFGASKQTDMITLAQSLINNFQYLFIQVMLTAITAIYIHLKSEDHKDPGAFSSSLCKLTLLVSVGVSVILFAAAPLLAAILAPSYSGEELQSLTQYLRWHVPTLVLLVIGVVFRALLHANKHFLPGELSTVVQNGVYILVILLLCDAMGANALVVAFIANMLLSTIMLAVCSKKYWKWSGYRFCVRTEEFRRLLQMMGPLFLGYSMVFVNQQVDKIVSSSLGEGVVTSLVYGSTLYSLVSTFILSGTSIFFSYVTDDIAQGRHERVGEQMIQSVTLFVACVLPIALIMVICARDIIMVVFGYGAFDEKAVMYAGQALAGYALALVPLCIRELFTRLQYGYCDSKGPMVSSIISILCNIVLTILLSRVLGVLGIAIATTVSITVCSVLNMIAAHRLNRQIRFHQLLEVVPYFVVGAAVCAGILWCSGSWLPGAPVLLQLIARSAAALLGYCVAVLPLAIRIFRQMQIPLPWRMKKK